MEMIPIRHLFRGVVIKVELFVSSLATVPFSGELNVSPFRRTLVLRCLISAQALALLLLLHRSLIADFTLIPLALRGATTPVQASRPPRQCSWSLKRSRLYPVASHLAPLERLFKV